MTDEEPSANFTHYLKKPSKPIFHLPLSPSHTIFTNTYEALIQIETVIPSMKATEKFH